MRSLLLSSIMLLFSLAFLQAHAQVPQGIPYQAAARGANGQPLVNTNVKVRFSIIDSIATGTTVYQEIHTATTNTVGLFSVNVGLGTAVTGTFAGINWGKNFKFMKVELDPSGTGSNYTDLGTQQMMSVPYALYAGNVNNNSFSAKGISSVNVGSNSSGVIPEMMINFTTSSNTIVVHFSMSTGSFFMGGYQILLDGVSVSSNGWYYDVSNIPCTNPTINDFLVLNVTPAIPHTVSVVYSTANWNNPSGYTAKHAFFINDPTNGAYRNLVIDIK
jgi:hypothetical protein